ncbi:MAG: TetR/AcrR family transcriptional regulator [Actinomycetota bacterium]
MPRLWSATIEAHRRGVREAILDTVAALVADRGLRSVTMSEIAEATGIGRATLYKYFPDVEAILQEWHEREITAHLDHLAEAADRGANPSERLRSVLEAYALMAYRSRRHRDTELAALLHQDHRTGRAERRVRDLIRDLIVEGVRARVVREDVAAEGLATFCLHGLGAAATLSSRASVLRLVDVTLDGLRPPD